MKLWKFFLPMIGILLSIEGFAQIESDSENNESRPYERQQAFERQAAAGGGNTNIPANRKRWNQGGSPGFLAPPSKGTSEIETDTQDVESEPYEQVEEFERREAALEKKGELSITGDVRFKWIPQSKRTYGFPVRGSSAVNPVNVPTARPTATLGVGVPIQAPTNFFEGEYNFYGDYDAGKDWLETQVRFKNNFGIDSGSSTNVSLKKAWVGYSFYEDPCTEFYVELGRKGLSSIFSSRIQFDNTFDGILLTYEKEMRCIGEFKIYGGPFIVDYLTNHYSWVTEADLEEIAGTGFLAKYSFIYWRKRGVDRNGVLDSPNYRFANSQLIVGYDFCPDVIGCNTGIYLAYLVNHAAKVTPASLGRKRNQAWYADIQFGKIGKKGDWLFDVCYQEVGYQAIPNIDMSGIGRGNSTSRGDTAIVANPWDPSLYTNPQNVLILPASQAEGNTNYRGFEVRLYYNITDRLTAKATTDYSWQKIAAIGGNNWFFKSEIQLLYDF